MPIAQQPCPITLMKGQPATHSLSSCSSLQVGWAEVKEIGHLHVPKMVELRFLLFCEMIFKFNPQLELVVNRLENSTSSSLGLSWKINPTKSRTNLETKLHHFRLILLPWPTKLLTSSCVCQPHESICTTRHKRSYYQGVWVNDRYHHTDTNNPTDTQY